MDGIEQIIEQHIPFEDIELVKKSLSDFSSKHVDDRIHTLGMLFEFGNPAFTEAVLKFVSKNDNSLIVRKRAEGFLEDLQMQFASERELHEKIDSFQQRILRRCLNSTTGTKCIIELLESIIRDGIPFSKVFEFPGEIGMNKTDRKKNLIQLIDSIKKLHRDNDTLWLAQNNPDPETKDGAQIAKNISLNIEEMFHLLNNYQLDTHVFWEVQKAIQRVIKLYYDIKRQGKPYWQIPYEERDRKITFRDLEEDLIEIQILKGNINFAHLELEHRSSNLISTKESALKEKIDLPNRKIEKKTIPPIKELSEDILRERAESWIKKQAEKQDSQIRTQKALFQSEIIFSRDPTSSTDRNPYVSELAKRLAGGYCQLCKEPAPFKDRNGIPYLETHHIIWLSNKGEDTVENTIALCPNCHSKMHILDLSEDVEKLRLKVGNKDRA